MDPFTQGLLGASASLTFSKKKNFKFIALCGLIGGIAPDLDFLIRSESDPLLAIEYHRHFTHSLFFIPFGGFIISLFLWLIFSKKNHFKEIYKHTTIGYATHGFLDSCTSYGTLYLWPFYNERISWDIISIIDPVYSITLLISVGLGLVLKSHKIAKIGFALSCFYLLLGVLQHYKISTYQQILADDRGHKITQSKVNPTIGNLLLWRSVYRSGDRYYIDAVRMPYYNNTTTLYKGKSSKAINISDIYPIQLGKNSLQRNDLKRFYKFSQGFIYRDKENRNLIGDLRYGTLPNDINSLWGIILDPNNPQQHAKYVFMRDFSDERISKFKQMLMKSDN